MFQKNIYNNACRLRQLTCHSSPADVSKQSEVSSMIQTSVNKLGPLNTMIANAGIAQVKPLLDLTESDMQRMFNINVFGVHNCFQLAAKQMISQGPPPAPEATSDGPPNSSVYKLISAASIVAFKPFPLLSHYSASKWAVRGLTQGDCVLP
jgi:short-subunit dehydrogenase